MFVIALSWSCKKFDITVIITEDSYLKLRVVVHYEKGNPYQ